MFNRLWRYVSAALVASLVIGRAAHAITPETAPVTIPHGGIVERQPLKADYGLAEAGAQFSIRYSSIDGVDGIEAREDTGAVFLPKGPTPQGGWPVVVWAHGTVGIASACAPSLNVRSPRDIQYLDTWLSLGFAVVAPDYAGLGSRGLHHYLNSRAEAYSVLDSLLAARSVFPLQNRVVLIGQSQGAHAAFAAAGYQPQYAPDVKIIATILTGTPYFNAQTSAGKLFSSQPDPGAPDPKIPYAMYMFLSAADRDPSLNPAKYFSPQALPVLREAHTLCIDTLTDRSTAAGLNAGNSMQPDIQKLLDSQTPSLRYPTLRIQHPVFIGMGSEDNDVPLIMQQAFARDVTKAGTKTLVRVYQGLDHDATVNPSLRDTVPFLLQLMSTKKGARAQ
ncbi:alpha/beta hydrolase [Pandoraea anhela]|uniref:Lipase n=1 Tax=Pandoraea anhela TaxID=2508295 RepID=A0A5E4SJQ5_9BURK|nr:alpha/beta fold hydrolase [Pandoraea anhela]VVD74458.1 lipase [Pandoraea anhela]